MNPHSISLDQLFCFQSYTVKISGFGIAKIDSKYVFDQVEPWPYKRRHAYAAPEYVLTEDTPTGNLFRYIS